VKIALAQYPIGKFSSVAEWQANAERWVAEAAGAGATLLVFPEYGGMELTSLLPEKLQQDLYGQIAALDQFQGTFIETYSALVRKYGVFLLAPSLPCKFDGAFYNYAHFFGATGSHIGMEYQVKRQMTRFEKEQWGITGGGALKVIDIGICKIGIAICYDIEFPLIAHAMARAGADLILAPSCTDTMAGSNRVHVGARARALENQVYVAVAPTVGLAPWSPAVDVNRGRAAAYATPDRGFPDDGILARGELDQPGWVYADLDFDRLRAARQNAQVFTRVDWDAQALPGLSVTQTKF
jgi:predicted amidohydrolase